MQRVTFANFEAYCLGRIRLGWRDAYLHLTGSHNAVRAIWAKLSGSGRGKMYESNAITIDNDRSGLSLENSIRYRTFQRMLSNGMAELIVLHPGFGGLSDSPVLIGLNGEKPLRFYEKFIAAIKLPFKPEDEDRIWELGNANISVTVESEGDDPAPVVKRGISRLDSFGNVQGYLLGTELDVWAEVLRQIYSNSTV